MPILNILPNHHYSDLDVAVYNPHGKPVEELPVIYGTNNGGSSDFLSAILIAQDGTILGSHICSDEGFMPGDLGVLDGFRPDRHETFRAHYPDGYRMEFISYHEFKNHPGIQAAAQLAEKKSAEKDSGEPQ